MEIVNENKLSSAGLGSYFRLAKPKTIFPHLITASAAMFLASAKVPVISTLALTLLGGTCMVASANIFNSYVDRDIDALMERTRKRPLPSGQISHRDALIFGLALGIAGFLILEMKSKFDA